jgi:hypothetical protein
MRDGCERPGTGTEQVLIAAKAAARRSAGPLGLPTAPVNGSTDTLIISVRLR